MNPNRILVTGANGLIGRELCIRLLARGISVRALLRRPDEVPASWLHFGSQLDLFPVGDITLPEFSWEPALSNIDTVIHLAARTHVLHDPEPDPLAEYRRFNVGPTRKLAEAAAGAGVRRFIYISSVKVLGEQTTGTPFTEADMPLPEDAYGQSKMEAELVLLKMAIKGRFDVTILRPPLVYGPGVRGNFLRLMRHLHRGLPLVLSNTPNKRSLIGVGNLADLLVLCAHHSQAANQTFLVSDGHDVSTAQLAQSLARNLGRKARILLLPKSLLVLAGELAGRQSQVRRLTGSLEISINKVRELLNWAPPQSLEDGIRSTAEWYIKRG